MTKVRVDMELCCFCLDFHNEYMKGKPFNYGRKQAVTECWLCEQAMCADCNTSSQKELQDDVLALYGLTMCQRCITQVRRLTTWHQEYEVIVKKRLTAFKAGIREEIYTLTQEKHAISNRHT